METVTGPAARLLEPPEIDGRTVRHLVPEDRAVVLGSTQPASHVDTGAATAAGTVVVRRRSGGGAVLVGPDQVVWTDVVVPAGDPLWTPDVGRAFWWLGDAWAGALAAAGLPGAVTWRGGMRRSPWSDRVCFAGLGPGEVTIGARKVVGLSQRRTRAGACFQCAVPIVWDPSELLAVMALDDDARSEAASELASVAMGVGAEGAARLLPAFVARLP